MAAGDSCLDGKLGQQIGNELVTVVDDPTMMGGPGAIPVDDEGVNTREKVLIKNGVLTEYLNHRETAHHFGVEPTAVLEPRRASPSARPHEQHDDPRRNPRRH